jgi:hypothetical protein
MLLMAKLPPVDTTTVPPKWIKSSVPLEEDPCKLSPDAENIPVVWKAPSIDIGAVLPAPKTDTVSAVMDTADIAYPTRTWVSKQSPV